MAPIKIDAEKLPVLRRRLSRMERILRKALAEGLNGHGRYRRYQLSYVDIQVGFLLLAEAL